uniref:Aspartic peptidase DDI1-type domain-containing protein n=1 Tax=Lactuca sativa TaxID=4236 RepID=A0A9R1XJT9_LACSA|nr:hypothetical protein LSAT_V11C300140050 [Lactuca sativa]
MQMFLKVHLNIPLLDTIKQVPRYAKFLKELCISKKKLKGNETVKVGENILAVLQKRMPPKCKDPNVFTMPCKLRNLHVPRAMIDLGASINVLPKTDVIIQLVDRSIVNPKGVLEDVLVHVNELVFLANFFVLDMGVDDSPNSRSILLGRPFLKTAKTKIDVCNATLSMEFDGERRGTPVIVHSLNFVDIVQPLTEECLELTNHDFLELVLNRKFDKKKSVKEIVEKFKLDDELLGIMEVMNGKKNIGFNEMGILRKVRFQELEEFQNKTFENLYVYKNKNKAFHDKYLSRKSFETCQKVLLYDSHLKWFFGKLRSRWMGLFIVTNIFDHGAVEIKSNKTRKVFKVNGHRLKVFYEGFQEKDMEVDSLERPDYIE